MVYLIHHQLWVKNNIRQHIILVSSMQRQSKECWHREGFVVKLPVCIILPLQINLLNKVCRSSMVQSAWLLQMLLLFIYVRYRRAGTKITAQLYSFDWANAISNPIEKLVKISCWSDSNMCCAPATYLYTVHARCGVICCLLQGAEGQTTPLCSCSKHQVKTEAFVHHLFIPTKISCFKLFNILL